VSEVKPGPSYYQMLGVMPGASVQDIRRAYRELSKLYHPDTTELPTDEAREKFQALNEAYATLCNPDRRASYDLRSGYSRVRVMRPDVPLHQQPTQTQRRSSAYLDPSDRPLSPGEMFALFMLGVTFVACLLLVVALGLTRGDVAVRSLQEIPVPESVRQVIEKVSPDKATPPVEPPPPVASPNEPVPSDPSDPAELPPVGQRPPDSHTPLPKPPLPNPLHLT